MANDDRDLVKARPQHEGKDPLAGGERLHNLSNSSDAESYAADHNELDAPKVTKQFDGPSFQLTHPAHKIANKSKADQAIIAKGRTEKSLAASRSK